MLTNKTEAAIMDMEAKLEALNEDILEKQSIQSDMRKQNEELREELRELEARQNTIKYSIDKNMVEERNNQIWERQILMEAGELKKEIAQSWEDLKVREMMDQQKDFWASIGPVLEEEKKRMSEGSFGLRYQDTEKSIAEFSKLADANDFSIRALAIRSFREQFRSSLENIRRKRVKGERIAPEDIDSHRLVLESFLRNKSVQEIWMTTVPVSEEFQVA